MRIPTKKGLSWLWCLPQNILGALLVKITKATKHEDYYTYNLPWGSVTLGEYILIAPCHQNKPDVIKHEKGHRIQSRILGWFYLPVIGIPSFVWATFFEGYRRKHNKSYYDFYTEKWANILGGVEKQ